VRTSGDLFGEAAKMARASDPRTSHEAALEFLRSGKRDSQHAMILRAMLHGEDGKTAAEYENLLGIRAHKRLPELVELGLVRRGESRTCGSTGMNATTWWVGREAVD